MSAEVDFVNKKEVHLRTLKQSGHVGFDSLPDQLVNKSVQNGFVFNVMCIGVYTYECGVLHVRMCVGVHICGISVYISSSVNVFVCRIGVSALPTDSA